MGFKAGHKKKGGKVKGTQNKLTKTVKECFEVVFTKIQNNPNVKLEAWAIENPTEFYKLSAKLIPTAIDATIKIKKIGKDLEEETYE